MRIKTAVTFLIFIGLVLYSNILRNGFVGDDFLQIVNNTQVHSLTNIIHFFTGSTYENGGGNSIAGLFYRPVMLTVFSFFYTLFGLNPLPYHLFQILLHIANALLVFFFFRYFFKEIVAFLIALLFLIHPINNEAVVYIANLQETLFFFFGMLGLLFVQRKESNVWQHVGITLCFLLTLFSKETGVLFLVITFVYCYFFQKKKAPHVFFLIIVSLSVYLFFRYMVAHMEYAQGSIAPIANASFLARAVNVPSIIFFYINTFFYPSDLGSDKFWFIRSIDVLSVIVSIVTFLALFTGGFVINRKKDKLFSKYIFFFIWFGIGLLIHLQIIPLDATVATRWFYFPIVGLLGMFAICIQALQKQFVDFKRVGIIVLIGILIGLSVRTYVRNFDWVDSLTLHSHDIQSSNNDFILENALATDLINDGQFKKAKPYVFSSIRQEPYYANLNNAAIIYTAEKNYRLANLYLQKAVSSTKTNYVVYQNYANFLYHFGTVNETGNFVNKALQLFPRNEKLWLISSEVQYEKGDIKEALFDLQKSNLYNPTEQKKQFYSDMKNGKFIVPRTQGKI